MNKQSIVLGCRWRYPLALLCLKRPVYALIITAKEDRFYGMNHISSSEITQCPRKDLATGEGYDLCKNICLQGAHTEVHAINEALACKADLSGAKLYMAGHDYCCEACLLYLKQHGLISAYCIDTKKLYEF